MKDVRLPQQLQRAMAAEAEAAREARAKVGDGADPAGRYGCQGRPELRTVKCWGWPNRWPWLPREARAKVVAVSWHTPFKGQLTNEINKLLKHSHCIPGDSCRGRTESIQSIERGLRHYQRVASRPSAQVYTRTYSRGTSVAEPPLF